MVKELYTKTGEMIIIDDEDFARCSGQIWWLASDGHPVGHIVLNNGKKSITRLARFIYGTGPVWVVDKDPFNLQKHNLTLQNLNKARENVSASVAHLGPRLSKIYKGTSADKRAFSAFITLNAKRRYLGSFDSEVLAARAYDMAAFAAWGTECYLNFPEDYGLPPREPKS